MMSFNNIIAKLNSQVSKLFNDDLRLLFYINLSLPLIYIPNYPFASRSLRIVFVIVFTLFAFMIKPLRNTIIANFKKLNKSTKLIFILLAILIVFSTLLSHLSLNVILLGREPDFMGLFAWLSLVPFGLIFAKRFKELLFSFTSVCIISAIIVISLIAGITAIKSGYRIPGLLMQATTMAIYSSIGALVALEVSLVVHKHKKIFCWLVFLLSFICTLFTQSRVGYLALIIVITAYAVCYYSINKRVSLLLILSCVLISVSPLIAKGYFSRLNTSNVNEGVTYRQGIYLTSGKEALRENIIIGKGPNALPVDLNNNDFVPEDIAKTLNEGYLFISSHDLFLDVALYFGVLTSALFGYLCIKSFAIYTFILKHKSLPMSLLLICLLLNAFLNVFSPELTSMLVMVVVAGLVEPRIKYSKD